LSYKSDSELLAKTVLEYWENYDHGDYSPKGYCCNFCNGSSWKSYNDVSHDLNCPVLVAKDILTKAGK